MPAGIEEELEQTFKTALEYALNKIEKNIDELKDSFPFVTVNGKWEICKEEDWDLNIFNIAVDNSLIFGDYYYMEGLIKLIIGGAKV